MKELLAQFMNYLHSRSVRKTLTKTLTDSHEERKNERQVR